MAYDVQMTGTEIVKCRECGWSGKFEELREGNRNSPDPSDRKAGVISETVYCCPNPSCLRGFGLCLATVGDSLVPYLGHSESMEVLA